VTQELSGTNWPQYRKFSTALTPREIIVRASVVIVAVAAVAALWMPDERMLPPKDMHIVTYVTFPRVEIVGKRQYVDQPATAVASAVKLVGKRD
jgi:hypothetical protein